jgi:hypothetical protein
MSDIKYTSDGKKVLVVGKLNAEQTIVQEIFVSAGQEIPSGENFVVKSLHEQPAESWKEKHLRELEERFDAQKKKLEREMEQHREKLGLAIGKAKLRAEAILNFANKANDDQAKLLKAFMCGEITHMFIGGYSPEIVDCQDSNKAYDVDSWHSRIKLEGIKLVSLMGKSDGDLSYRLHDYRDGSGSSKEVFPARSYQEALKLAQAQLDKACEGYLSGAFLNLHMEAWQKIDGICIPDAVIQKAKAEAEENRRARIEKLKEQIAELEGQ